MEDLNNPAVEPEVEVAAQKAPGQRPASVDDPKAEKRAEPDTQGQEEPERQETEEEKAEKKKRFSERFGQITAARRQAEAERDQYRQAYEDAVQQIRQISRVSTDDLSWEQQQALQTRYLLKEQRAEELAEQVRIRDIAALDSRKAAFEVKLDAARNELPGFDESAWQRTPLSPYAAEVLVDLDNAAHVAHHLMRNQAEAHRIYSLPPHMQGAEIARLAARVTAPSPARKVSKAPPPPAQLSGGASPGQKSAGDMSVSELQAMLRTSGVIR